MIGTISTNLRWCCFTFNLLLLWLLLFTEMIVISSASFFLHDEDEMYVIYLYVWIEVYMCAANLDSFFSRSLLFDQDNWWTEREKTKCTLMMNDSSIKRRKKARLSLINLQFPYKRFFLLSLQFKKMFCSFFFLMTQNRQNLIFLIKHLKI